MKKNRIEDGNGKANGKGGRAPMTKTEILPCKLTEKEIVTKARELAALGNVKQRQLDSEQSAAKSDWKNRQEGIDRTAKRLCQEIDTGVEHRPVEVKMERNLSSNSMEYIRVDTGEIYHERPLTTEERQGKLFQEGGAASRDSQAPPRRDASARSKEPGVPRGRSGRVGRSRRPSNHA